MIRKLIVITTGIAIALMVSALGHISGGLFNPAPTIGLWATRRLDSITVGGSSSRASNSRMRARSSVRAPSSPSTRFLSCSSSLLDVSEPAACRASAAKAVGGYRIATATKTAVNASALLSELHLWATLGPFVWRMR